MVESMATIMPQKFPLDLARILGGIDNCITTTPSVLSELYGLYIDKKSKLEVILRRIRARSRGNFWGIIVAIDQPLITQVNVP